MADTDSATQIGKNIIICSDGTGCSGGTGDQTNVWRLYEALAPWNPDNKREQLAIHDDGVGTQRLKPLRIMGLAVGLGISHNLAQLYAFLMRHFNEGDHIYLFGFSRGAFTARTLSNMLYYCGIADRRNEEGAVRTPEVIDDIARRAVTAYRRRNWKNPDSGDPFEFRTRYGLVHQDVDGGTADSEDPSKQQGRFPIEFVGVWDTVDAVGLPVDELTQFCCALGAIRLENVFRKIPVLNRLRGSLPVMNHLFGHVLHRPGPTPFDKNIDTRQEDDTDWKDKLRWEDDLHENVERARHAICIDDERYTFHPTMFLEHKKPECVQQVWFSGVHSNVGGGYPKDGLALVPLVWMMHHAKEAGLAFTDRFDEYARDADEYSPQYDSRSFTGMFYRYRPRNLTELCSDLRIMEDGTPGPAVPRIHVSVLRRIHSQVNGYAPTGFPPAYETDFEPRSANNVDEDPVPVEHNADFRDELHERARDLIWWRRVLYYVYMLWVLLWVAGAGCLEYGSTETVYFLRALMTSIGSSHFWISFWVASLAGGAVWAVVAALWRNHGPNGNTPSRLRYAQTLQFIAMTGLLTAGILFLHGPLTNLLDWVLPAVLSGLCDLLKDSPAATLMLFVGGFWLYLADRALSSRIASTSFAGWQASMHCNVASLPRVGLARPFQRFASWVRKSVHPNKNVLYWKWKLGPTCVFAATICVIALVPYLIFKDSPILNTEWNLRSVAVLLAWIVATAGLTSSALVLLCFVHRRWRETPVRADLHDLSRVQNGGEGNVITELATLKFSTRCFSFDTGVCLKKRHYYLIGVSPCANAENAEELPDLVARLRDALRHTPPRSRDEAARLDQIWQWRDETLPATPDGLLKKGMTAWQRFKMRALTPWRRYLSQPWFRLLGKVEQSEAIIPIGTAALFQAPADGRLRLFVNDAERYYGNNLGVATIRIYSCEFGDEQDV